jgi:hypothetical protein
VTRAPSDRPAPATRPVRRAGLRPGARPSGGARRTPRVRRASAGLTPVRAGALLVMLAACAAVYGLASSNAFNARHTIVTGATWTSQEAILAALAVPADRNVFAIRAGDLERAATSIPALSGAAVTVSLPDTVHVAVTERRALLLWKVGDRRFLVDGEGLLFADLGTGDLAAPASSDPAAPASGDPAAVAGLPVIDDGRSASTALATGSRLDPVTLDAALRIGSLSPADVGSGARALVLRVDDTNGFTMRTDPASWVGVFGFYTPTLRTTDLIPGQVRLLRSLIAGREDGVQRIVLADDHSGTYVPRITPQPSATARPAKTPRP